MKSHFRVPWIIPALAVLCLLLGRVDSQAAQIDLSRCVITGPDGARITQISDNNLDTVWTSGDNQRAGMAVTVDFGRETSVHRVYLMPGKVVSGYPRGFTVSVGDAPDKMAVVATATDDETIETDLRFNPVTGRYLKLSITGDGAGYPWVIAELMVWGTGPTGSITPKDCVVVDKDTPMLDQAGAELSYYLGELSDAPVPVVDGTQAANFPGTVFHLAAPPDFPNYAQYVTDPRSQADEAVSVARKGHDVVFGGNSELGELYSVYEFLDRNGVHWLYPNSVGDYVPAGKGIDLTMLPITFVPSFEWRQANWSLSLMTPPAVLWHFHNHWDEGQGSSPLNRRPGLPKPDKNPASIGYTHTFSGLVPESRFATNPDWFPLFKPDTPYAERISGSQAWVKQPLGVRVPYSTTFGLNFCTSNQEVVQFVTKQVVDQSAPANVRSVAWLVPMDSALFCECDNCQAQNLPLQYDEGPDQAWKAENLRLTYSNQYMTFITQVAKNIAPTLPNVKIGAFGYDTYRVPPSKFATLPDNVTVDVIQNYAYNLPVTTSARNAWWKGNMEAWASRWNHPGNLGIYDWALLHGEGRVGKVPVPCVTALAASTNYYYQLGARRLGTQAVESEDYWRYNPWNYYAYSRLAWNAAEPAPKILNDFFTGYYQESSTPMLDYYNTLETHLISHDIPVLTSLHFDLPPAFFSIPVLVKMDDDLTAAQAAAKSWYVVQRVTDARDGYNELLGHFGLTTANLRDPASFQSLGAVGSSLVLTPGKSTIFPKNSKPEPDGSWMMPKSDRIGFLLNFTQPGHYRVSLALKCWQAGPCTVRVLIGDQSAVVPVQFKGPLFYTADINLTGTGVQEFAVQDMNTQTEGLSGIKVERVG